MELLEFFKEALKAKRRVEREKKAKLREEKKAQAVILALCTQDNNLELFKKKFKKSKNEDEKLKERKKLN